LYNWGVKQFFSGDLTPKPEVELVGEERELIELEERYQKKISRKFPRFTEIYRVKEKPLAPPSSQT